MKITFSQLQFEIENERIYLLSSAGKKTTFAEVQVCGENKDTHMGVKMANSSEGNRLRYVSHTQTKDHLEIVQKSDLVQVKTVFNAYMGASSMQIYTEVTNITDEEIILEEVLTSMGLRAGKEFEKQVMPCAFGCNFFLPFETPLLYHTTK